MPDVHEGLSDKENDMVNDLMQLGKDEGSFAASLEQQALLKNE